jgi:GNAT superfamily N-acetyltransferase
MSAQIDEFRISSDPALLQPDWIISALHSTYWAGVRTAETIQKSIRGSLCYGIYSVKTSEQVGFARVVTDQATFAWLCDVVIDPACRGVGLGKLLVSTILADERLRGVTFHLGTRDAHGFYERQGFARSKTMRRKPVSGEEEIPRSFRSNEPEFRS